MKTQGPLLDSDTEVEKRTTTISVQNIPLITSDTAPDVDKIPQTLASHPEKSVFV